ncbi:hypothetical protein MHU86_13088 [Fragilaria crotonensis]|nr:hypothetical protein MHU86_13088 [Fragilaria crotonensis]
MSVPPSSATAPSTTAPKATEEKTEKEDGLTNENDGKVDSEEKSTPADERNHLIQANNKNNNNDGANWALARSECCVIVRVARLVSSSDARMPPAGRGTNCCSIRY